MFTTELDRPRLEGRRATIDYSLADPSEVSLAVFDVAGRRVAGTDDVMMERGRHSASIALGNVAHGVYFVRMRADGKSFVRRLPVLRVGPR